MSSYAAISQLTPMPRDLLLLTITDEAGGMVRFVESDELSATATLEAVETTMSTGFAAFLFVIAADYYESEDVSARIRSRW